MLRSTATYVENSFTSIFPACYSGRWPHIHFEVYPNRAAIADSTTRIHGVLYGIAVKYFIAVSISASVIDAATVIIMDVFGLRGSAV